MTENLYAIWHGSAEDPQFVYVGKTLASIEARFSQHLKGAQDPSDKKELCELMRHIGTDQFSVMPLDNSKGQTERFYVETLTKAGHKLTNSNRGNSKVAKTPNRAFAKANREADERIERKARLYNKAQNYTKSEVVRQRIRGDYPTLDELLEARWTPCPAELLSADVGRTAERAEYCKLGDISVFIAFKNKDRLMALLARHYDGRECRLPKPMWYGPNARRETLLRNLESEMTSPYGGFEKVYAA